MSKGNALIDTGPLVVLIVGSVDPDLLGSLPHLKQFVPEDALILEDFLAGFHTIAITPHVATEAAHFLGKPKDQRGQSLRARFAEILNEIRERSVTSRLAASRTEFAWLDLADCSLLEAGRPQDTLLSTDAVLVYRRQELGFPAVNFNHLRERAGLL